MHGPESYGLWTQIDDMVNQQGAVDQWHPLTTLLIYDELV